MDRDNWALDYGDEDSPDAIGGGSTASEETSPAVLNEPPGAPAVSVLMTVYNAERYVSLAVESVLNQTFRNFEFIIIDDGCTDGSRGVLERCRQKDSRIRLVVHENRGLVACLNEGLAMARAPLIARMDADDIAEPPRLERQVQYMAEHPETVCVGCTANIIDDKGRFIMRNMKAEDDAELQRKAVKGYPPICHPCAMYRRDAVLAVGGYQPEMSLAEDLDLFLRLGEIGKLANLPEPLMNYRHHATSLSRTNQVRQLEVMRMACEAAWRRRGIQETFELKGHWSPEDTRHSLHRFALRYGWSALRLAQVRTAHVYAWKAIGLRPFAKGGWRLLAHVWFPRMRRCHGDR